MYEKSGQYFEIARDMFIKVGDQGQLNSINYYMGLLQIQRGNFQQAEVQLVESLNYSYTALDQMRVARRLEALAYLACCRSEMQKAARLWGAAEAIRARIGTPPNPSEETDRKRYISPARSFLPKKVFLAEEASGAAMSLEQAVAYAREVSKADPIKKVDDSPVARLTTREREVLRLVAQGLSDGEVAERLVLSPRTVNAHLTSIYNKLGVSSRVAATRIALEHGLV
jgi:DNA-binding CsgD family transcriptional regulator